MYEYVPLSFFFPLSFIYLTTPFSSSSVFFCLLSSILLSHSHSFIFGHLFSLSFAFFNFYFPPSFTTSFIHLSPLLFISYSVTTSFVSFRFCVPVFLLSFSLLPFFSIRHSASPAIDTSNPCS